MPLVSLFRESHYLDIFFHFSVHRYICIYSSFFHFTLYCGYSLVSSTILEILLCNGCILFLSVDMVELFNILPVFGHLGYF